MNRHPQRRLRLPATATALALSLFLLGCPPEGEGLPPQPGAVDYQRDARIPFPLAGSEGHIDAMGGNLLLRTVLLSTDTRLGTLEVAAVYNSATGSWTWSFEPRYGSALFTDETGARHDVSELADGSAVPGTHWVKLDAYQMSTKSGRVHAFGLDHRLASMHWGGIRSTRLQWAREPVAGVLRTVRIDQCHGWTPCQPLVHVAYDGEGRVSSIEDSSGRRAEVDWATGRLVAIRDGLAVAEGRPGHRYLYAGTQILAVTNGDGERVELEYSDGRVTQVRRVGAGDPTATFAYASDGEAVPYFTEHTDARGHTRVYRYDADHRLHEIWNVDADEQQNWTWSGLRPASHTAADGTSRLFTWLDDDLVEESLPSGNVSRTSYAPGAIDRSDPLHRPVLRREDDLGLVEEHVYDEQGRLVASTNGAGETTTLEYETGATLPSLQIAPSGAATRLTDYGDHGHPLGVQRSDSLIPSQQRAFDAAGNRTRGVAIGLTGPGGVVERAYDDARNLREIRLLDGEMIQISVRSDGRPLGVLRPNGADHEMDYDALGRMVERRERVDGTWQATRFEYDAAGNRTAVERPNGMRQEWDYDAANRAIRLRNLRDGQLEGEASLDYANGQLHAAEDTLRGGVESYVYGSDGRLAAAHHAGGRLTLHGRDARGRLTATAWLEPGGQVLRRVERDYDGADRELRIRDGASLLLERVYENGRPHETRYGNGLVRSFLYEDDGGPIASSETRNAAGELVEQTSYVRELQWPQVSLETSTWVEALAASSVERYDLLARAVPGESSPLNRPRVAAYQAGAWTAEMSFDTRSNLVQDGDTEWVYNAEANRLLAVDPPAGDPLEYVYDDAGFVTSRDGVSITWHANGRIASHGADVFAWDVAGRLLSSTVDGQATRLAWDGAVTTDASGTPLCIDLHEAVIDLQANTPSYRHLDFRENVKFASDEQGEITSLYTYSPFALEERFGSDEDPVRFVGRSEVGDLMLVGERVYDPAAARFLSPDPVFQWVNQYAYTLGNPIDFHDRTGRTAEDQSGNMTEADVRAEALRTTGEGFLMAAAVVSLTGNLSLGAALLLAGLIMIMIAG